PRGCPDGPAWCRGGAPPPHRPRGGARMARFVVGVDTGKRRHRAAVYDAAGAARGGGVDLPGGRGGCGPLRVIVQGRAGGARGGRGGRGARRVGGGGAGHYPLTFVEYLRAAGWPVVLLDPYRATQFRRSEGHRAKTDRLDARALARFLGGQPGGGRGAGAP